MKAVFIETADFTDWVSEYLPDEALSGLQQELMKNPEKGSVMGGAAACERSASRMLVVVKVNAAVHE